MEKNRSSMRGLMVRVIKVAAIEATRTTSTMWAVFSGFGLNTLKSSVMTE